MVQKRWLGPFPHFLPCRCVLQFRFFTPHAQGWGEPPAQVTVAMSSLRKCARKKCRFMQSSYGARTNKCFPWEEEKCCDLKPGRSERREVGPGTWWKCLESCKAGSALDWLSWSSGLQQNVTIWQSEGVGRVQRGWRWGGGVAKCQFIYTEQILQPKFYPKNNA